VEQAEVRTQLLPVKLTEVELALKAQELATAEAGLGTAEMAATAYLEEVKAEKGRLQSEVEKSRRSVRCLARIVRERAEEREVPIVEQSDFEAGAVNTVRTDTGEVVATRGMTPEERQRSLFSEKGKRQRS
jgi:hypothetical protein